MGIAQRYVRELNAVEEAARLAGRDPQGVRLVAVSKTVGVEGVREAYEAGARDFGENRPDQIVAKAAAFPEARWHFIGNIQSRRIHDIVASAWLVHSLYQYKHAVKINEEAARLGKVQDVLIEVNVSGELSKSGVSPDEALSMVKSCASLDHVRVRGFMTMAPQGDASVARKCFEDLASLHRAVRVELDDEQAEAFTELSMGMSEDWPEAVAAGASIVRVGRAIFSDAFE